MKKENFDGLMSYSVGPDEIRKVDIPQLGGLTMQQWYDKQTDKPDLFINASLWDEKGAIGTIFVNGKKVRDEGTGLGFGINKAGDWGFGDPWTIAWDNYITGMPGLVEKGVALNTTVADPNIQTRLTKRSVVATVGNRLYFITADNMNIAQLRQKLTAYGFYNAINLDGGGSSRLMVNGVFVNNPTDNRANPNGIAIWLKKSETTSPTTSTTTDTTVKPTNKKVFLGVGHGGVDSGAVGYIVEKAANLVMAQSCADELRRHGVDVMMSRTTDVDDPLNGVAVKCNAYKPDLAMDCHNNSGGGTGFEIFHSIGGGTGKTLAENVNKEVIVMGQKSRGVKTRANSSGTDYYGFIRMTSAPAVICEGVFVDSKEDYAMVDTLDKQKMFGVAYAKGILKTLGINYIEKTNNATAAQTNLEKLADIVKAKYGFDSQTMEYLTNYKYAEELLKRIQ